MNNPLIPLSKIAGIALSPAIISVRKMFPLILIFSLLLTNFGAPLIRQVEARTLQKSGQWLVGNYPLLRRGGTFSSSPKINPYVASMLSPQQKSSRKNIPLAQQKEVSYSIVNAEFKTEEACKKFAVNGVTVFNRYDRFADLFIPLNKATNDILLRVGMAQGLKYLDMDGAVTVPPPTPGEIPKLRGKQESEKIIRGGLDHLTGKGVIIAIVDSGIDFRNPDFITYDAAGKPVSRLLYLWDTTSDTFSTQKIGSPPPLFFPNKTPVGTLYTKNQLTAELRAEKPRIPATDLVGHGTACAGVAAGNGNNGKGKDYVQGVAPEADIIAIRAGGGALANGQASEGIGNAWLLNYLCGWLETVAGNQPLVVSCSFGGRYGGHDGQRVSERQLDLRFAPDKKGRALVIAAGNEGFEPIHAEASITKRDEPKLITWVSEQPLAVTIYFDSPLAKEIKIVPAVKKTEPKKKVSTFLEAAGINPITGNFEVRIVSEEMEGGLWLFNLSDKAMQADAYIEGGKFVEGMSQNHLVGSPGIVNNAITVGSYDWNDQFDLKGQLITVPNICDKQTQITVGAISCYSSPGYSRTGIVKPDIAAPGEIYHASYAKHPDGKGVLDGTDFRGIDSSGNYMFFNGTSAATPYTAGVIALMFQKSPQLSVGAIKDLLRQYATKDQMTGKTPNKEWGHGKLDLAAIGRILEAIKTP